MPEEALRAANAKFERRFARMEALAAQRGLELKALVGRRVGCAVARGEAERAPEVTEGSHA